MTPRADTLEWHRKFLVNEDAREQSQRMNDLM
jgi:hypothetical protein